MHNNSGAALTVLARMIAGFLAALFVVTALTGLILFNVERRAFNPETYKQALVSGNFYQQFPYYLLSDLLISNINGNAPVFLKHLSENQRKDLIQAILPEQVLQAMTEDTLNQFFAYLNGETDTPRISLIPLKNGLASPAGLNAVMSIIQSQPDCTLQEIVRILISFGQELCNPPQEILDLLHPVIQSQLQTAASAIPDSISILMNPKNALFESGLKNLRAIRLFMRLSLVLPITLLLAITLIAVRTFKSWLVWWGWPLLLTGLFGIPLGFTGAPLFRWIVERWLSKRIALTLTPDIATSLRAILDATLREILKPAAWESLALFIIGLSMILISAYLTYREKNKVAV
jgi:hypothetical protein